MRKLHTLTFLLILIAPFAQAQVYKCVDAQGRITYSSDGDGIKNCHAVNNKFVNLVSPPPQTSVSTASQGTSRGGGGAAIVPNSSSGPSCRRSLR